MAQKLPSVVLIAPSRLVHEALGRVVANAGWPVESLEPGPVALLRHVAERGSDTVVLVVEGGPVRPLELAAELRRAQPALRFVLVLTAGADAPTVPSGTAVVSSDATVREVVEALGIVSGRSLPASARNLTTRQIEILQLVARGLDTEGVAASLGIAPKTVNNHLSSIYLRLKARNLTQAVLIVARAGLIDVNGDLVIDGR